MNARDNLISITIVDRTYQIKCPPEEATRLREAAKLVDMQMRKTGQSVHAGNAERLAIIAALNIAHELLAYKNQKSTYIDAMHDQVKSLQHRIQKFLNLKEVVDTKSVTIQKEELV